MQDIDLLLKTGPECPDVNGPGKASHADRVVPSLSCPVFIAHPMTWRRKMRTNIRSVDHADLMYWSLIEEGSLLQLIARQGGRTARNHLPSHCSAEGQAAHSTPIECG